jgi:hypothetical protein
MTPSLMFESALMAAPSDDYASIHSNQHKIAIRSGENGEGA